MKSLLLEYGPKGLEKVTPVGLASLYTSVFTTLPNLNKIDHFTKTEGEGQIVEYIFKLRLWERRNIPIFIFLQNSEHILFRIYSVYTEKVVYTEY